jgi:hypothetical protein
MTGSAGADPTTGMVEEYLKIFRDIQEGHRFAVAVIGKRVEWKFYRAPFGQKCYTHHSFARGLGEVHNLIFIYIAHSL